MDDDWEEFWSKFYIISKFFQNLCEENHIKFKEFFNNKDTNRGEFGTVTNIPSWNGRSKFFELYIILETTANYTNFWINEDTKLVPSDKEEVFIIF